MQAQRVRVVIAEDSEFARAVVVSMLDTDEFDCHEARDGREALDLCRILRPDLLILDLQMPRLNGDQVLAKIKSDSKIHDLPVLVLTADEREETVSALLEAGATDFIIKPARPAELVARVRRALRDKQRFDMLLERAETAPALATAADVDC
jgi:DNA-binding response OmpR family regulator